MNQRKWLAVAFATLAACGGNNDPNNTANNTTGNNTINNTTVNNTTANNTTVNNTTANNTTANNSTANNTTVNNTTGSQDCSLALQDGDGNGTTEFTMLDYYENEDWEHPVRQIVTQQASPFQSNTYAVDNAWDTFGNIVEQVVDFGNDGSVEWILTLPHDANGRQTGFSFDNDADGTAEFTATITYDEFGEMTRYEEDGIFDPATWTVSEEADGTPNLVQTITWRGAGQPTEQIADVDNDGTPEVHSRWTYDANGNLTRFEADGAFGSDNFADVRRTADGTPDIIHEDTYDADGKLTMHREDGFQRFSADGTADLYEQQDGTWDFVEQDFTYDANGNRTGWRIDGRKDVTDQWYARADGTFDRFQNITWTVVTNRPGEYQPASVEFDEGDDGSIDFAQSWQHDADGNMTHRETDGVIDNTNTLLTPADGTFQDKLDISYLAADKWLSYTRDFDGDSTNDVNLTITYNDAQLPLTLERDGDMEPNSFEYGPDGPADGNLDRRATLTYDELNRQTSFLEEVADGMGGLRKAQGMTREYGLCADLEARF